MRWAVSNEFASRRAGSERFGSARKDDTRQ
ncbi:MAG: hypothetical protein JWQ11_3582 [Rhizobacter sp.]|nr:hypothetical protein [Rhizobacter sp.]